MTKEEKAQAIFELEELAASEGLTLPMAPARIVSLEAQGAIVDLATGNVLWGVTVAPTPSGCAVNHLLLDVVGEVAF